MFFKCKEFANFNDVKEADRFIRKKWNTRAPILTPEELERLK